MYPIAILGSLFDYVDISLSPASSTFKANKMTKRQRNRTIFIIVIFSTLIISAILASVMLFVNTPLSGGGALAHNGECNIDNVRELYLRLYPEQKDRTFSRFVRLPNLPHNLDVHGKIALWQLARE